MSILKSIVVRDKNLNRAVIIAVDDIVMLDAPDVTTDRVLIVVQGNRSSIEAHESLEEVWDKILKVSSSQDAKTLEEFHQIKKEILRDNDQYIDEGYEFSDEEERLDDPE